ncbi:VAN3-binding protein-like [Arachis hypogaea]|uniref:VAN3-binding protein-like n=1 Tax=Arachis hypogaea TaxID=3818 RepID=UPI0007AFD45A
MKRSEGCWRKKWLPFWSMTGRETEGLWKKNIGDLKVVGGELLKRTRKGDLHWKQVSFNMNSNLQVIVKMKSKHMVGTFTKKKKCIVTGVCRDVQAWPGREKEDLIEKRAYFGIKTAERIIEFECESKRDKQFWLDGIQYMLNCRAKAA